MTSYNPNHTAEGDSRLREQLGKKDAVPMKEYEVFVGNIFDATSPEDAVRQMVVYLQDNASQAGYRVTCDSGESVFIDAEELPPEE